MTPVAPESFLFADDGEIPNNPRLPLVLYRGAVGLEGLDPAANFERLFARHGWADGWRNGIFDFRHFHTGAHEVLGIASGRARVEFGGAKGREVELAAGDVAVLPAGCGHRRVSASRDLLVVGAYPKGGRYDHQRPGRIDLDVARAEIARTALPDRDPVYGENGPLTKLWQSTPLAQK
jgi:uncharacterized protein YjlB